MEQILDQLLQSWSLAQFASLPDFLLNLKEMSEKGYYV